jgi:hypothetical protein
MRRAVNNFAGLYEQSRFKFKIHKKLLEFQGGVFYMAAAIVAS